MKETNIGYYFLVMASVVIVLAGIKSASEIIVPFLLSLFLAIILLPTYNFFNKKGLPESLSLFLVISIFILLITLVGKLIGSSVHDFNSNIDFYTDQLSIYYHSFVQIASKIGIEISVDELSAMINSKQIMSFASNIMQSIGSMFTNGFVVLLTIIFMLLESKNFKSKIEFASNNTTAISHMKKITSQIKEYMVLKAIISAFTGLVVWIALVIVGTDYAFLWAVVAFLFNFIPNIGSIIAAVPAVLLTLVQLGALSSVVVAVVYVAINVVIGSVVEPRVMGKGLGLSTLVVFLSLIFWGWLLGIVGMLLSIPLTIMVKIILDDNDKTRWISVLLGSGDDIKASK
ncbi:MAG: AI-2E family transporter [Campylobacterota bacterium]|nr:AI-2E family transporter [Campylobacterota bacterium]